MTRTPHAWWTCQTDRPNVYVCGYGDREIVTVTGINAEEARFIAHQFKDCANSPLGYPCPQPSETPA